MRTKLIALLCLSPLLALAGISTGPNGSTGGVTTNQVTGNDFYVAPTPLGNNSNAGTTKYNPFADIVYATSVVTNSGQTIHLMTGTNLAPMGAAYHFTLAQGVSLVGDGWNSVLYLTNNGNINSRCKINVTTNNLIQNLSIYDTEPDTSAFIFGAGAVDTQSVGGATECVSTLKSNHLRQQFLNFVLRTIRFCSTPPSLLFSPPAPGTSL
jgi:hypothetical protein